jgi:hypothetical protein
LRYTADAGAALEWSVDGEAADATIDQVAVGEAEVGFGIRRPLARAGRGSGTSCGALDARHGLTGEGPQVGRDHTPS